jgi:hypothetical protein
VKTVELTVNGAPVPPERITFAVNGGEHTLDELPERWDDIWFVLDAATLRVRRPLIRAGARAEVRLRLGSRIPYILLGPEPLEHVSERVKELTAA